MRRITFRIMARRPRLRRGAALLAAASLGCAGLATGTASAMRTASAPGYAASVTAARAAAAGHLVVAPHQFSVARGTSEVFGVSLSAAPSANVTVTVRHSTGNAKLTVSAGRALRFTPSNWNYPQPVTVSAGRSGTGSATFTARAPGYPAKSVTGTETPAGPARSRAHVVNPFTHATWYVNPDYTAEGWRRTCPARCTRSRARNRSWSRSWSMTCPTVTVRRWPPTVS